MARRVVAVFGGSGFIGRYVVRALVARGDTVRAAVRHPDTAHFLRPMGDVGQVVLVQANLRDEASVARAVAGADAVVNAAGIYRQSGAQTFRAVHADGYERLARAAHAAGVRHFVQLSGIGVDLESPSAYVRSKAEGEAAARREFAEATVLRSSVVFGIDDSFFNQLAAIARVSPLLPLFGHTMADAGQTRIQPVYVGDVAAAVVAALDDPRAAGVTYELGGPRAYSYREVWSLILAIVNRRRLMVPIPFALARIQAGLLAILPNPPLTRDQLVLMEQDNVPASGAKGLADLGIKPTPVDAVLPRYLARFRRGSRASRPSF